MIKNWVDKDFDEVLELSRDLLEDTSLPTVKIWRAQGGKVLGHFQVYFRGTKHEIRRDRV
jgi:benzoyl-CoA reductase subunit C